MPKDSEWADTDEDDEGGHSSVLGEFEDVLSSRASEKGPPDAVDKKATGQPATAFANAANITAGKIADASKMDPAPQTAAPVALPANSSRDLVRSSSNLSKTTPLSKIRKTSRTEGFGNDRRGDIRPKTVLGTISDLQRSRTPFSLEKSVSSGIDSVKKSESRNWGQKAIFPLILRGKDHVMKTVVDGCVDTLLHTRPLIGRPVSPSAPEEMVFEISDGEPDSPLAATGEERRINKSRQIDEPRAVGVRAMQQLAARYTTALAEIDLLKSMNRKCEADLESVRGQLAAAEAAVEELGRSEWAAAGRVRELEAAEMERRGDHARQLAAQRARADEARAAWDRERTQLEADVTALQVELRARGEKVSWLEESLSDERVKLADLERLMKVVQTEAEDLREKAEAHKKESTQLSSSFEYARENLRSVRQGVRELEEGYLGKIASLTNKADQLASWWDQERIARMGAESDKQALLAKLEQVQQTLAAGQAGWERAAAQRAASEAAEARERERASAAGRSLRLAVAVGRWLMLASREVLRAAFPEQAHAAVMAGCPLKQLVDSAMQSVSAMTVGVELAAGNDILNGGGGSGEFWLFWSRLVQRASEMDGRVLRFRGLIIPPRRLLNRISSIYVRKALMDQIDDRNAKPRQHLANFIWDLTLSEFNNPGKAASNMVTFIANVLAYTDPPESPNWTNNISRPETPDSAHPTAAQRAHNTAATSLSAAAAVAGVAVAAAAARRNSLVGGQHGAQGNQAGGASPVRHLPGPMRHSSSFRKKGSAESPGQGQGADHLGDQGGPGGPARDDGAGSGGGGMSSWADESTDWATISGGPTDEIGVRSITGGTGPMKADVQGSRANLLIGGGLQRMSGVEHARVSMIGECQLQRIDMFSRLIGAHQSSTWDLGSQQEAADVYLEGLVRMQKGLVPLLPDAERGPVMVHLGALESALDIVCAQMRHVDRARFKLEIEKKAQQRGPKERDIGLRDRVRTGEPMADVDKALEELVNMWLATVYDTASARLEALFIASDINGDGELDFNEFLDMAAKVKGDGGEVLNTRNSLRMYSQMSVAPRIDAKVFCSYAKRFGLNRIRPGRKNKTKATDDAASVFVLLEEHWRNLEHKVLPLVWTLDDISVPQFLEENVNLFRLLLRDKTDPAVALLAYRSIVQDLPATVRKTIKSFFPS